MGISKEKIFLVMVENKFERAQKKYGALERDGGYDTIEEALEEMRELIETCGGEVCDFEICRLNQVNAGTLIGKGKLEEIVAKCQALHPDCIVFSCDLRGSQQRNLEEEIGVRVIDRTQVILDIFARHASSKEGKLQVELAQLEYLLPRLAGVGKELSQQGGGIGTRGPGETKLEVDRRRIENRLVLLEKDLEEAMADRETKRKKRKSQNIPSVCLVGYTSAGKSTLMNALSDAQTKTHAGLFTTLDSLSRQLVLPNHQKVVLSDTIGFIRDLPHHLVESFKVTLEDVKQADLLLHVLDISHPSYESLHASVMQVLGELESDSKPMILVLNKIDRIEDQDLVAQIAKKFDGCVCVSAQKHTNIEELLNAIVQKMAHLSVAIDVKVPFNRMDLVDLVHRQGDIGKIEYLADAIHIQALVPRHLAAKFEI